MEPVAAARRIVEQRFPEATAALVGGAVLGERRTPTSDLDLVVLLPGRPAPYRETFRAHGWIVEVFAHTRSSLEHYWALDAQSRRPALLRMCAEAAVVLSRNGQAQVIRHDARGRLDAGPSPISDRELASRRYALSDLLDDLDGNREPAELPYIAALVLLQAGELALLSEGRWLGTGKWLHRELAAFDTALASRFVAAHRTAVVDGDRAPLTQLAVDVLDRVGGRLFEGYFDYGEDPQEGPSPTPA